MFSIKMNNKNIFSRLTFKYRLNKKWNKKNLKISFDKLFFV